MTYEFRAGQSAELLVARLGELNWRGAIVGPHGAGKSALLATLVPHLTAAGRRPIPITLRDGQRRLPSEFLPCALMSPRALIVVDGYEQLSRIARWELRWRCRRASAGLLVTSHTAPDLPNLTTLQPNLDLVQQLVARLTQRVSSPVTPSDIAASHACHGSSVREILFDLYDRHERVSRAMRTTAASTAYTTRRTCRA